jgi:hypothetical protein
VCYQAATPQIKEDSTIFNEGWNRLVERARIAGIPFIVMLHPETPEIAQHRYDARGQQVLDSLHAWHARVVELLTGADATMYWDIIHLNDHGQRTLGRVLEEIIRTDSPD